MKELIEKAIQINKELAVKLKELEDLEEPNLLDYDGKFFTCKMDGDKTKGFINIIDTGHGYIVDCSNLNGKNIYTCFSGETPFNSKFIELFKITELIIWDYLPEDGEYFTVVDKYDKTYIGIAKMGKYITSSYAFLDVENAFLHTKDTTISPDDEIQEIKCATNQDIKMIDDFLKKNGKWFDPKSKSIEDLIDKRVLKIGEICIFWDTSKNEAIIAKLNNIVSTDNYLFKSNFSSFENCIPFTTIEDYLNFIKE